MFPQNSERVARQKNAPVRVIIGNPPYSIGQKSANDNAQNQKYELLDKRLIDTYVKRSKASLNRSLYDAYIRAFRWATDRLDSNNGGIIAFVTNAGWLDGNSTDGFRKCIEKEFSSIYVFNLRGNGRTTGELCRQEGEPLFAAHGGKGGSLTPVAICFLVKNPKSKRTKASIHYHDIGNYLKRGKKLEIIKKFKSINNIDWEKIEPNEEGDWIAQRNELFNNYIPINPVKKFISNSMSFFSTYAVAVNTGRDAWVHNFSKIRLIANMSKMIDFYNEQRESFLIEKVKNVEINVENFIEKRASHISWTRSLKNDIKRNIAHVFEKSDIVVCQYRPFFKQRLYFNNGFIEAIGLSSRLFPKASLANQVICTSASDNEGLSVLMSNTIVNFHFNGDTQCFPLYYFEERKKNNPTLFDEAGENEFIRRDGVSDFILERAKKQYGKNVGKEDIFYYVYGILHSPDYRTAFANDLKKMLPRIPLVEDVRDFWKFSKAGRQLAELHINYESVPAYSGVEVTGANTEFYRVEKMRFPKKDQKDKIIFNSKILISNIPEKAYEYVVNGKSAIEWIMERYAVTTNKDSGITNNPNDWAEEVGNPRYILDLLLSIINVSVQTVDIVNGLPKLEFETN